jgi:GSH-dependent disulfide-bond oxidoreductase
MISARLQWLMVQMGSIGPTFGQVGFFQQFPGCEFEDKRPRDRYVAESSRVFGVLEPRLAGRARIMGEDHSFADIAILSWVRNLFGFYGMGESVGGSECAQVNRALNTFLERPVVVQHGLEVPKRA